MFDVDDELIDGALPLRNFDLKLFSFLPFDMGKSTSLSGVSTLLMDLLNIGLELLSLSFAPIRGD